MLLWLQRACAGDIPDVVKRGCKNVDVYNSHAKLIFIVNAEAGEPRSTSKGLYYM